MTKQRVIFCTYSSIYSSKVLERLLASDKIDVVAIINSTRVIHSKYGFFRGAIKQIKTSGFRYATYLFMVTDLFRWLQPLSYKEQTKSTLKTVHKLAAENNIPVLDTLDINNVEGLQFIQQAKPDYLLAAHFNQLIKAPVLDLSDMEFLNIHPSLLPNYKGVDPVFFALLDQNKEIGVTLHKMAESFDSGEILRQKPIKSDLSRSLFMINNQLFEEGAELAIKWIANTQLKSVDIVDNTLGQYDSWPSTEQIKRYKKKGNHLITLSEFWKEK
ncbi:MAG: hypothetical protein L3J51_09235 [Cocleimonas sp.]|nr:hypothetical protein [Cocleimonas sp.]